MPSLEEKVDRLTALLIQHEENSVHAIRAPGNYVVRELVVHTVLASVVGYFMFRILDHHFRRN